ncbi:WavE lipopolysaccharide synthesis family protein [Vibrio methylphosphonaticus]|uniref:WavE lipopolysaccharide synthesis family protein n=1 Tax=Vibrio methylphosphonaticus TaxID=2946866 RepID=UPI00202AB6F9|nr:WavE lipopolysaccharide synthesis family protein [Vibrio methylphosphonaticus]MCL9775435.1 WavE lipopolysaccharide synthesis family protein [Vibrio methylphosphonaticus]
MTLTIPDSDITFVVQGPVQATAARTQIQGVTHQCLESIQRYFPGSPIILSTWQDQSTHGLNYDVLVESVDPGPNVIINGTTPQTLNNNRLIVSSHAGLTQVKTRYAVKLRTDNVLSGRAFLTSYLAHFDVKRDPKMSFFKQRVLTSSAFFIGSHYGKPVHFHKSDLFDFGLTEDLLKIWSGQKIGQLEFHLKPGKKERYPATEQFLCLSWLSDLLGLPLHINNKAGDSAGLDSTFWENFLANNLIVDTPEALQLDVTARFYKRGNLSLEYDILDWKALTEGTKIKLDRKRLERAFKSLIGKLSRNL